jgi:hypothetical protein
MGNPPSTTGQTDLITITRRQAAFASWMTDVLLYVVVINLFVEYAPSIIIESFTTSLFTAILLKLMLDLLLGLEHRVKAWFAERAGSGWRLLGVATMFAILFLSKFVILEITDIVFGDRVTLGGFLEVVVLIVGMIATREGVAFLYHRVLGQNTVGWQPGDA